MAHQIKTIRTSIFCTCLLLCITSAIQAKGWRGITPLQSSRADVERLLGTPTKKVNQEAYLYNFGNEVVVVLFQSSTCDTGLGRFGFGWNAPPGTVTNIGVIPLKNVPVAEIIDVKEFRKDEGGLNFIYYIQGDEGLTVETLDGNVVRIIYESTAKDESRRCPRVEEGSPHFNIFDQYGNISFGDEKARLDNFAIRMTGSPTLRGIIIAYGGRRGRIAEAKKRAERAKNYLVKVRGIEPWRIVAGDGGYREDLTVELFLRPIADSVISRIHSYPTLLPSDVELIQDSKAKKRRRRYK
jgi:hypothetical protein